MKRLILLTVGFFVTLLLIYSWCGYPLLTNDTYYFLPTAFELKYNHSLTNEFYDAGFNNGNKFLFYPPLFPFFISKLIFGDFIFSIFLAINLLNILSIICVGFICYNTLHNKSIKWLIILFIIACASYLAPSNSRPELLVQFLFYLFISLKTSSLKFKHQLTGILIAITLFTSPINGFYLGMITLICMCHDNELKIENFAYLFFYFFIVIVAFSLIYPYSIRDLILTMQKHAKNSITDRADPYNLFTIIKYHVLNPLGSAGVFIFSFSIFLIFKYLFSHRKKIQLITLFAILVFTAIYLGFKSIFLSYNIYSLSPFALYSIFYFSVESKNGTISKLSRILFFGGSISLFYTFLVFLISIFNNPKTIQQVNNELSFLLNNKNCTVEFSSSFWPLFKSPTTKCKYNLYTGQRTNSDYILLQQYTTGLNTPRIIVGYKIIKNDFDSHLYFLKTLRIMKYKPFYQYVLYKKK